MSRSRFGLWVILLAGTAAATTGCLATKTWNYSPKASPVAGGPILDKSVVVLPFAEARPYSNKNRIWVGFIPLMPYGWEALDRPELYPSHRTTGRWIFKPTEDLAKSLAAELANARLFRQAGYAAQPGDAELVLEGKVLSTLYRARMFTYCLSVFGSVISIFGAPSWTMNNTLSIEMTLKDRSGRVLWFKTFTRGIGGANFDYHTYGDFRYDLLFEQIAAEAIAELSSALRAGR